VNRIIAGQVQVAVATEIRESVVASDIDILQEGFTTISAHFHAT